MRRYENRRGDPLMDEALARLGRLHEARSCPSYEKKDPEMTAAPRPQMRADSLLADDAALAREGRRILRRPSEPETVLAVTSDMEKAVVLLEFADRRTARTAVIDRAVAQAFVPKD